MRRLIQHARSQIISLLVPVFLLTFASPNALTSTQSSPIDLILAAQYFQEAKALSQSDNGRLWRTSLYGPMLFVDRQSRFLVANQADAEGKLTRQGDVFVGTLPAERNIANTAVKWAGVEWTMVMWPLPDDKQDRGRLMIHESFHRIQGGLGLPGMNPANSHLDTRDGRIWLQMEWRALAQALMLQGAARRRAIEDALVFRSYRRSLFPQATSEENALEINEGLAEYSGFKLSSKSESEAAAIAVCDLRAARRRPSFARSFAYVSGPAYGQLLASTDKDWTRDVKADGDLGVLLQNAVSLKLPQPSQGEAMKRIGGYDGEALIALETRRENLRQQELAKYRALFIEQPVLVLPLSENVQYSFDPGNVVSLDANGTIYPGARVSDAWGILEAAKGALLVREDGRVVRAVVPLAKDVTTRPVKGDGWSLQLNDGWQIVTGTRQGDMTIKKVQQ